MKRFALLLAALAGLLAPVARTAAVPANSVAAPAFTEEGTSKIPAELCLAVLGQDFEKLVCSNGSGGV